MSGLSLASLMEAYFVDLRVKNWSEMTLNRRRYSLGRFIGWLSEREIHALEEISPEIVAAYQRSLYHVGNLRNRKPLRSATQASYLHAVAHWLQWACLKKHLSFNPAIDIELPKEEHRLPGNYLTQEEVEHLINQPDVMTPIGIRDRVILEVLYSTAMRRSELLGLRLNDLDRSRRLLSIRQGKGKKDRIVPIGVRALEWLEKYLQDVRPWLLTGAGCKRIAETPPETDRLILNHRGREFTPEQLTIHIRGYIQSAGIKKAGSCHMLRHTAATLMLENGADLRSLQTLLGHASLNTTQIYTHITIDRLRAVHEATHPARPDKPSQSSEPPKSPEEGERDKT